MKNFKSLKFLSIFALSACLSLAWSNEDQQRYQNWLNQNPAPQGISQSVWQGATKSFFSQCAGGGGCKCALVVAQGRTGDVQSVNMWIGTFLQGSPRALWSGYGSRLAIPTQNRTSVNMPTTKCKRRNGIATVNGEEACIPGRRCRPAEDYRSYARSLGLPDGVALTSFYFGVPMHNEMYKFHDFYPCEQPPCAGTFGCLGLEKFAMKDLCINHMGNNGSNGLNHEENGGVWLYFHNVSDPPSVGDESQAGRGLSQFQQGSICQGISQAQLGSGVHPNLSGAGDPSEYNDSASVEEYYNNSNGRFSDMGQALSQAAPQVAQQLAEQQQDVEGETFSMCVTVNMNSCPQVEEAVVRDYCTNTNNYEKGSCEFKVVNN